MTEESSPLSGGPSPVSKKAAPAAKRISTPRPKKVAKEKEPLAPLSPPEVAEEPRTEWPEPEVATSGGSQSQTDPAKRKRRRRKGKGAGANNAASGPADIVHEVPEELPNAELASEPAKRPPAQNPPQQMPARSKVDPEQLTKMAWKIFLAEVSEEGVALITDQDAKDLSRRCFRLAEIFIEEHSRRR